ncbi:Coenzyme F420 hydrogenase/dehydrogenase, beta subunit C-terminal domain [Marimonas arenosa]|uniref:Coenzyme F420 hydrogenase/dehydrogenase, beta subunit C-terminal domain n=1 Tax=Marimonas arenosa TaxID=1795305 RepID=A0AAE4B5U0_9RHOB|nr:Coenzyme F420 hydrogenase/dehydrogenase, beta subunit C-terminal domain [Marimonas arenosa]MDQ2089646.1 Coenzyme F420 hydrogenase/dehydrogenase, beta subunit C-terminal domain [Marimonas arenosa]
MSRNFETLDDIIDNGFCIGCGLCKALAPGAAITMAESENGHLRPRAANSIPVDQEAAILRLCPGINVHGPFGKQIDKVDPVWGQVRRIARGYAADPDIRFRAAAGGIMTALSQFLIDSGLVSKVLQVQADPKDALHSRPVVSRDAGSVLASSGSRYATCATLETLPDILAEGEPIAVAMKPCDIAAIRNLQAEDSRARELIVCTIALFCGTVPSLKASDDFLARRGLAREDIAEFRWRGHGCPGPTYARTADGREFEGPYREFWVDHQWTTQFRCKICPDAVGLQADIATGDAWPGGWPTGESEGWNMLIAHTEVGEQLLAECEEAGKIRLEESDIELLSDTQPHHVDLRRALAARLAAARIAGLPEPNFRGLGLNACSAGLDPDTLARNFAGTLTRVRAGQGDQAVKADYAD